MANLQIENLPEDTYERLKSLARQKGIPLTAEAARLLEKALDEEAPRSAAAILEKLRRLRANQTRDPSIPDSADLIREDRER